ncbi:MAG: hypothetical protein ACJ77K_04295 [Bacteroidia bacterium]
MKTQTIRILTFSVFLLLIGLFVAYRAGAFDSMFGTKYYLSDVHIDNTAIAVDTPGVKSSTTVDINQQMMSSSKSMVIYTPPKKDTVVKDTQKAAATAPQKPMMGGSKSAIIFSPKLSSPPNNSNNPNQAPAKPKN